MYGLTHQYKYCKLRAKIVSSCKLELYVYVLEFLLVRYCT